MRRVRSFVIFTMKLTPGVKRARALKSAVALKCRKIASRVRAERLHRETPPQYYTGTAIAQFLRRLALRVNDEQARNVIDLEAAAVDNSGVLPGIASASPGDDGVVDNLLRAFTTKTKREKKEAALEKKRRKAAAAKKTKAAETKEAQREKIKGLIGKHQYNLIRADEMRVYRQNKKTALQG